MVRLSLRIDWELAAQVFDASFRRYVGRKNINVHKSLRLQLCKKSQRVFPFCKNGFCHPVVQQV
jgi:hypothetical protein